jgi:hypothetical protein
MMITTLNLVQSLRSHFLIIAYQGRDSNSIDDGDENGASQATVTHPSMLTNAAVNGKRVKPL